jgi:putative ABC transport system permease protein
MRLARHAIAESLVLGIAGALCGLLVAQLLLGVLRWLSPGEVPRIEDAALSVSVAGFGIGAAVVWVLAFGTAPIWTHWRIKAPTDLGMSDLSLRGARGTRGLRVFTIAEIAAAVLVAVAAGLLVRSFVHLQRIDRGFSPRNLAVIPLLLPQSRYPDARARLAFYDRILPRVTALPGVVAASALQLGPGTGSAGLSAPMIFDGQTPEEATSNPWASWEPVTPSYFRTLGIPLLRGRAFSDADHRDSAPVAIVSEAVARRYWPGQDAVGRQLRLTRDFPWVTVVGVVADVRYRELTKTWLTVYFPAAQFFFFSPSAMVVRTASAPEGLVPAIREMIRADEPYAALETVESMETLLGRELVRPRTALTIIILFAAFAMSLSAIGVYGVMSYDVRQRRRELAVRSALGASPARVFNEVVLRSVTLGAIGAVAGLVSAWVATRALSSLLFEV